MIYLNSCLRCKGDVQFDSDTWGVYMKCLQCGKTWNARKAEERADVDAELAANTREPEPVIAESEPDFGEEFEEPIEDPYQIRRAS